jgi:drug/metabolite transporter (DMT)-like permease
MLLGRSVFGTIGMLCYFYGIDRLILADSGMLNKMHPFFVTIFAFLFLKEKISWHQLVSLLVALTGSALIIKPGFDFSQSGPAFICFLSAVFAGLAYVFVSYLGNRENSYTIVFWFSLISSLITLPLALMHFRMPSPAQLLLLIGAGGASAGGQFSLTCGIPLCSCRGSVHLQLFECYFFEYIRLYAFCRNSRSAECFRVFTDYRGRISDVPVGI